MRPRRRRRGPGTGYLFSSFHRCLLRCQFNDYAPTLKRTLRGAGCACDAAWLCFDFAAAAAGWAAACACSGMMGRNGRWWERRDGRRCRRRRGAERMGVTKERGGWGNDYIEPVLLSARREPAARLPLTWALLLGQRPSVAWSCLSHRDLHRGTPLPHHFQNISFRARPAIWPWLAVDACQKCQFPVAAQAPGSPAGIVPLPPPIWEFSLRLLTIRLNEPS